MSEERSAAPPPAGRSSFFLEPEPTLDASVILPVRNEGAWIGPCLDSILSQHLGRLSIEILVVDGRSTDGTRDEVLRRAKIDTRIRLLDNPERRVSAGLNEGMRAARGRVFIRMDAHSLYEPDYVAESLAVLESTGSAAVGGTQVPAPAADRPVARAIAAAQASRFGTGGGRHRLSGYDGPAETLWLGAFRRELVGRIGGFDEALFRSEDNDFYQRARGSGGTLRVSPRIRARYICRPTFAAWANQCYVTGTEIAPTLVRNVRAMSLRHFAPGIALLALLCLAALGVLGRGPAATGAWLLLALGAAFYAVVLVAAAITANAQSGAGLLPLLVAFPLSHASYAVGTLVGVLAAVPAILRRGPSRRP